MTDPFAQTIAIDATRQFEHLGRAPIVESVIDFRARVEAPWEESETVERLRTALPEYPKVKGLRGFVVSLPIQLSTGPVHIATPTPTVPATPQDRGWVGARLETADGLNLATFSRDGFSFSRLKPYLDWDRFSTEALRLWEIHAAIAAPSEIQRIGVRSINRLEVPIAGLAFSDYLKGLPENPGSLGTAGFIYHDVLSVPGHPYTINLIRTFQPPEGSAPSTLALLLDIDVLCPGPMTLERGKVKARLAEMRWLKNRVFFESVTDRALDLCR